MSNSDSSDSPEDDNEIIETEYFDIPLVSATANAASTTMDTPYADIESDAVITDHLQYLSYESWLAMVPSSKFITVCTSREHNDGGANCFISNNIHHFATYTPSLCAIIQLDGSTTSALRIGLNLNHVSH